MHTLKQLIYIATAWGILSTVATAHVTLDYPSGGETFNAGDVVTVQWHIAINHGPCTWELYYSINGGSTWATIVTELPKSQLDFSWTVPNVATNQGRIKVVQNNASGRDYDDQSGDFTIHFPAGIHDASEIPEKFVLLPAYPNPFNSSTVIAFDLPVNAHVTVQIYDLLGRRIQTLLDEEVKAGRHRLHWDAGNLPSGIYLYQIRTEGISETRRLVLTK